MASVGTPDPGHIREANARLRALTAHNLEMLRTPPDRAHIASRYMQMGPASNTAEQTMSYAGPASGSTMNKEVFMPNISDRIKQSRRSSTKTPGSPLRLPQHCTSRPRRPEAIMSVNCETAPFKRGVPIDSPQPPSPKRHRSSSEAIQPSIPYAPLNDGPNLAELLLSQSVELNSRNSLCSARQSFNNQQLQFVAPGNEHSLNPTNVSTLSQTVDPTVSEQVVPTYPSISATAVGGAPAAARCSPMQKAEPSPLSTYISRWAPGGESPFDNFAVAPSVLSTRPSTSETRLLNPLSEAVSLQVVRGPRLFDNPLQVMQGQQAQPPSRLDEGISWNGHLRYPAPVQHTQLENTRIAAPTIQRVAGLPPPTDTQSLPSIQHTLESARSAIQTDMDHLRTHGSVARATYAVKDSPTVHPRRVVKLPVASPFRKADEEVERGVKCLSTPANEGSSLIDGGTMTPSSSSATPETSTSDQGFVDDVKKTLRAQSKWKTANVGKRQAKRILQLLEVARPPDDNEALFLSSEQASKYFQPNAFFPGPVFTANQQSLPLQTVEQFLSEYYDDEAKVWIQDPSVLLSRNMAHAREITISKLKQRFLQSTNNKSKIPWNCLELATHHEDGLRPAFLNNEDCRLLTKLKHPSSEDQAARRGYEPGWKEVEKWALVAQGGALTEPHQDSHGYATYITMNQGIMGFGWLAHPDHAERREWRTSPATFKSDKWRYAIIRAGQTVFFPSGTVHFVFRLQATGDTLAFGGHVLRCSHIVNWVKTLLEEQAAPGITNEDITVSAPAYLDRVEKFVKPARRTGQAEKWGGQKSIDEFLRLKEEFMGTR